MYKVCQRVIDCISQPHLTRSKRSQPQGQESYFYAITNEYCPTLKPWLRAYFVADDCDSLIGVQRVGFIDATLTSVSEGASLKQRYAINFRGSVHDRAIAVRDAVLVDNDQAFERQLQEIQRLDRLYQDSAQLMNRLLSEQAPTANEQRMLTDIQAIERSTLALTEELISQRRQGDTAGARKILLDQAAPAYAGWLKSINAFIDFEETAASSEIEAVREAANNFRLLILLVTAAAVLLSVGVSVLIINTLKSTLGAEPYEVAHVIQRWADGDK